MNPPTPGPSPPALERHRSFRELILALLVVVLMSRFLQSVALFGEGPVIDAPAHNFTGQSLGAIKLSHDVLGNAQEISCETSAGSHWNCVTYEIRDASRTIFSITLSGHNQPGHIWFSRGAKPLNILVWQPWNSDEYSLMPHPIGYWRYVFDGRTYVRHPLLTQPLLLWLENPVWGLDL